MSTDNDTAMVINELADLRERVVKLEEQYHSPRLRLRGAHSYAKVSPKTIKRWIQAGRLPVYKSSAGRFTTVLKRDLDRIMNGGA